jgi:cell division protein FtsB
MSLVQEIRRRGRFVVGPTLGALVVGYFVFNAFQGDRGILAWVQIYQNVVRAEAIYTRTSAERQILERRTAQLESDSLDPDLLDERARIMSGLGRPGELEIFYPAAPAAR